MHAAAKKKHAAAKAARRTSTVARDIGLVVVSSLLSAATGFAAARDGRGTAIGALSGAVIPLAWRAIVTHDTAKRLGYGAVALGASALAAYLSWTRTVVGSTAVAAGPPPPPSASSGSAAASAPPGTTLPAATAGLGGSIWRRRSRAHYAGAV